MSRSITADRLRKRLNSVDKKFYDRIKKDPKVSAKYIRIATKYDALLKLINDGLKLSADLELPQRKYFALQASLGSIRCQTNSLELAPTDEGVVQQNDTTLLSLENELDKIYKEKDKLDLQKSSPKTFAIFGANLQHTRNNWKQDTQKLQAAYYYNFANYILDEIKKSPELSELREKTEKAIEYLKKASFCYQQSGMRRYKKETDSKITEVKKTLVQLLNPSGWTVSLEREEKVEKKAKVLGLITSNTQDPENPKPEQVIVKIERAEEPAEFLQHKINNNLPILQNRENPSHSLLSVVEAPIEKIKVSDWRVLHAEFESLPPKKIKKVKEGIYKEIREWLSSEKEHEEKFNEFLDHPTIPLDDGPYRGMGIFAKRKIPQFEVLGPYSGKLLQDSDALDREFEQSGERNVSAYLFGTRSKKRVVSAFGSGNLLSLINTADPLQLSSEEATESLERYGKHNNVAAIRVGKNIAFYVALEDIKEGTELLVSYGPNYKLMQEPMQEQVAGNSSRSKTIKSDDPIKNIHSVDQSNCSAIQQSAIQQKENGANNTTISKKSLPEISLSLNAAAHDEAAIVSLDPGLITTVNTSTKRSHSTSPSAEKSMETLTIDYFTDCLNKLLSASYDCRPFLCTLLDSSAFPNNGKNEGREKHISIGQTIQLSYSSLFKELIEKSLSREKTAPGTSFFKPTVAPSKETLIETLSQQLRAIKNKYKIPPTIFSTVCEDFAQIIANQFEQSNIMNTSIGPL
jgi:SET domain